jgi:hypothetical protein
VFRTLIVFILLQQRNVFLLPVHTKANVSNVTSIQIALEGSIVTPLTYAFNVLSIPNVLPHLQDVTSISLVNLATSSASIAAPTTTRLFLSVTLQMALAFSVPTVNLTAH